EQTEPTSERLAESREARKPDMELSSGIDAINPEVAQETSADQTSENTYMKHSDAAQTEMPEEEPVTPALDANAGEQQMSAPVEATAAMSATAEPFSLRRESGATCATGEVSEKGYGLGVQLDSRPASQVRSRRSQNLGPTQYTPVASSKKAALARGAPGLSYMFSPTISTSRPSSVVGMSTPPQALPARIQPAHLAESPEEATSLNADDEALSDVHTTTRHKDSQETAATPNTGGAGNVAFAETGQDSKTYGAINIGALEQFLDEGEIPASTSEEEYSYDDGLEWEDEYPRSSSRSKASSSDQSTFSSTKAGRPARDMNATYGSLPRQHASIPPRPRYASESGYNEALRAGNFSS
ncbi:hypothetical protein LPJ75_006730, partial [Coemansia sp. RSA 2598]